MAPARPPEVIACPDCTVGQRCASHKNGLTTGVPQVRRVCPACGQNPCHHRCPQYGKRLLSTPPPRFAASPIPSSKTTGRKVLRAVDGAEPEAHFAAKVIAWRALEAAVDAWLQHKEHADKDGRGTSPTSIARAESEIVRAQDTLRELRRRK